MKVVPVPPATNSSLTNFAGVSFNGEVIFKGGNKNDGPVFCGQGFITVSQNGSIGAYALPSELLNEPKVSPDGDDFITYCNIYFKKRSLI